MKTVIMTLRIPEELLERVTDWRSRQRPLPTRAEAIRRLLEIGLEAADHTDTPPAKPAKTRSDR